MLTAQGNAQDALKAYRDSSAIRERLAEIDPGNNGWQRDLAVSYVKLALVHQRLGEIAEALVEFRKARDIMAALVAAAPDNTQWKQFLAGLDGEIARLEGQAQEPKKN